MISPFASAPAVQPLALWSPHRGGAVFSPDGSPGPGARARPARILIVEDEYFVAMESETAMIEAGFEVVGVASTAEEAIDIAASERPDLVLMDIRLAGSRDGIDAALDIYDRFGIRSLFVTAHSDPGTRSRGQEANPLGWVSKPFGGRQLAAVVAAAVSAIK